MARLPVDQLRIDRRNGLNTAAFVSGYQGSPVGTLHEEVVRAAATVPDLPIVVRPGVNEELGATAVMGSQLVDSLADKRYDGVVGMWYGKAPGLDRAGDAIRHGVFAGTARHGGVVAVVGDDPAAKSSTLPSSSDATFVDLHMPILFPGDVQEALDLSRHAVALSRDQRHLGRLQAGHRGRRWHRHGRRAPRPGASRRCRRWSSTARSSCRTRAAVC